MSLNNPLQVFSLLKPNDKIAFLVDHRTFFKPKRKFREICPNQTCKPEKPPTFWEYIHRKSPETPPVGSCRIEQAKCPKEDPDFSKFDFPGTAYRTCGSAYAIEHDNLPLKTRTLTNEEKILMSMEANLDCKHQYLDSMPPFRSVEQRMMDLNERKLHPFYKMYQNLSHKFMLDLPSNWTKTFKSGPVDTDTLPKLFKYDNNVLDRKNIYFFYKRIEPPDHLTKRLLQLRQMQKVETTPAEQPEIDSPLAGRADRTFDSLYQESFEF